ncbi:uncharacterized protein TNCV_4250981 [Trichonephila clavipes]|nr:uncharacterized protein TNCV_4250981 [Trichonephila clavipes]
MRTHTITDVTQNLHGCENALSRNIQNGTDHSCSRSSQKNISLHVPEEGGTELLEFHAHRAISSVVFNCLKLGFNNLASVRVLDLRFDPTVPLVETHPVIYFIPIVQWAWGGALSLKLESPCYSYGVRSFDDVTILKRKKDETLGLPTTLYIVRMYGTIYVTVVPSLREGWICAMDNPSPVLRVEQSTLTSDPVRNVRLKGHTGKYVDRR